MIRRDGQIVTVSQSEPGEDLLTTVYENGVFAPVDGQAMIQRAQV